MVGVLPGDVVKAVNEILRSFQVIPFYKTGIVEAVSNLLIL